MKFYKYGFWIVLILLIALFVLNVLNIWPPRDVVKVWDPVEVRQKIEANYQSISDLFAAGDFEGIAALYLDEAVFAPSRKTKMRGKTDVQNFWRLLKEAGVKDVQFTVLDFYVEGEVSYDLSEYHFIKKTEEGEETNSAGLVMSVWKHIVECPRLIQVQNFNVFEEKMEEEEVE